MHKETEYKWLLGSAIVVAIVFPLGVIGFILLWVAFYLLTH